MYITNEAAYLNRVKINMGHSMLPVWVTQNKSMTKWAIKQKYKYALCRWVTITPPFWNPQQKKRPSMSTELSEWWVIVCCICETIKASSQKFGGGCCMWWINELDFGQIKTFLPMYCIIAWHRYNYLSLKINRNNHGIQYRYWFIAAISCQRRRNSKPM